MTSVLGESDPEGSVADEDLVERICGGEAEALGVLWRRYRGLMYSQALRILHNPTEAEDVTMELFEEVWRRAGGYRRQRARPVAWLITLVRRRAIDRLRERQSFQRAGERLKKELQCDSEPPNGVQEEMRIKDLRRVLERILERLPEEQRVAVWMSYFAGLSQREISDYTRTSLSTVKSRLEMALKKMRDALRDSEVVLPGKQVVVIRYGGLCCWEGSGGNNGGVRNGGGGSGEQHGIEAR